MLDRTSTSDATSIAILAGSSALLGDYALIGLGAVLGAAILASSSNTTSRIAAFTVLFRAWCFAMLFALPVSLYCSKLAESHGLPFDSILAPVAGVLALFSENLIRIKDQLFDMVKARLFGSQP